jgi:hypothetical protein
VSASRQMPLRIHPSSSQIIGLKENWRSAELPRPSLRPCSSLYGAHLRVGSFRSRLSARAMVLRMRAFGITSARNGGPT